MDWVGLGGVWDREAVGMVGLDSPGLFKLYVWVWVWHFGRGCR